MVDGGSADDTAALAAPLADRVMTAPRGRASQMNAGAAAARGDVLLFLHADTRLPDDADRLLTRRPCRLGPRLGPLRSAFRQRRPVARRRRHDEPALARDRHRHRRPGDLRDPRRLRARRRLSAARAHGRRGAVGTSQACQPSALSHRARDHRRPALAPARAHPHRPADVAAAACLLLRQRPGAAGAPLRRRRQNQAYCSRISTSPRDDQQRGGDAHRAQRLLEHQHGDERAEQHAGLAQ